MIVVITGRSGDRSKRGWMHRLAGARAEFVGRRPPDQIGAGHDDDNFQP
jgi:hypothetical protein